MDRPRHSKVGHQRTCCRRSCASEGEILLDRESEGEVEDCFPNWLFYVPFRNLPPSYRKIVVNINALMTGSYVDGDVSSSVAWQ